MNGLNQCKYSNFHIIIIIRILCIKIQIIIKINLQTDKNSVTKSLVTTNTNQIDSNLICTMTKKINLTSVIEKQLNINYGTLNRLCVCVSNYHMFVDKKRQSITKWFSFSVIINLLWMSFYYFCISWLYNLMILESHYCYLFLRTRKKNWINWFQWGEKWCKKENANEKNLFEN